VKPRVLNQFLNSIADAGKEVLFRGASTRRREVRPLYDICRDLLSTRGEASGTASAREIVESYMAMDAAAKREFFLMLLEKFGVDDEDVVERAREFDHQRDLRTLLALSAAVESPRQELLRRINMTPAALPSSSRCTGTCSRFYPETRNSNTSLWTSDTCWRRGSTADF